MFQKKPEHRDDIRALIEQCMVIVRSTGERTSNWSRDKAESIFGAENVVLIDERPMHKAIKKTFEIGIDSGKKWTVEIDADILLSTEGILQLLQTASYRPENSFFHFGMVFDKLTNSFRSAGNKIIRTKHLALALELIPEAAEEIRPDTFIRKKMAKNGYHYYRDVCLVGIHDFEQHYFDLYRKGYLQGVKNREKLERFVSGWPANWEQDPDYLAIKAGMTAGKEHEKDLPLQPEYYLNKFDFWKKTSDFTHTKPELPSGLVQTDNLLSEILTTSRLTQFQQTCLKNKTRYHVRSDVNWQYKLMKLKYRISISRIAKSLSY